MQIKNLIIKHKLLLQQNPSIGLFSRVIFNAKYKIDKKIKTAATDGKDIFINEDYYKALKDKEAIGLLLHEVMHIVLLHHTRRGKRDPELWNVACDCIINYFILQAGFELPKEALKYPNANKYTAEQLYNILKEKQENNELPFDLNGYESDLKELSDEYSKEDTIYNIENTYNDSDIHTLEKLIQTYTKDSKNAELTLLYDLVKGKLPWHVLLYKYVNKSIIKDYTWKPCNRRYLQNRIYLPTEKPNKFILTVAIDVSCSISQKEFNTIMSELVNVLKQPNIAQIRLITFNTNIVQDIIIRSPKQLLSTKLRSGGGTDIDSTIDAFIKGKDNLLLVFTDGYFDTDYVNNVQLKNKDIVWLIYDNDNPTVTKGEIINVKVN